MFLRLFGLSVAVPAIVFTSLAAAAAQFSEDAGFVPVTDAMLEDPAAGDWLMWRRTQNGWGYSPLDQVNRDNVGDLQLVWTRALAAGAQEGTPLAYGGVLFMPNPNDHLQAIDAVTGDLLWEYRRDIPDDVPEIMGGLTENTSSDPVRTRPRRPAARTCRSPEHPPAAAHAPRRRPTRRPQNAVRSRPSTRSLTWCAKWPSGSHSRTSGGNSSDWSGT